MLERFGSVEALVTFCKLFIILVPTSWRYEKEIFLYHKLNFELSQENWNIYFLQSFSWHPFARSLKKILKMMSGISVLSSWKYPTNIPTNID